MPQNPIKLSGTGPIVEDDGTQEPVFRVWALQVSQSRAIVGSGNPEGVVEAPQYTLFIDETVPTVPVQYRKMLPQIGGDRLQGWIVV